MKNDRKSLIILALKCLLLTAVCVSGLQAQETDTIRKVSGEYDLPLHQPVMNLGMKQIFNKRNASFANIADVPLHVSNIKQKTFVEVNEEGLEAPAPTAIDILAFGKARKEPEPIRFFADHPYLFLIREKSTGVILFIGRIDEPRE